jgi:hypothetical protein
MNEGLFKPTIIFFRLTNSPAMFQTMMNTIFAEEIVNKWLTVYMDNMAIHTGPKENKTNKQNLYQHQKHIHTILT